MAFGKERSIFKQICYKRRPSLNFFLFLILMLMLFYIRLQTWMRQIDRLPVEEGHTWPPPEIHVRPNPLEKREGPGEMGTSVVLTGKEAEAGKADMKKWFMNVAVSDKISLDRSLPDIRSGECKNVKYDLKKLPKASVIIIFTDEAWTPLLRTIHSVINRSPPELLAEVLLIDDYSQRKELKEKLEPYLDRFEGKVKLHRLKQRNGLIRAKLFGAKKAKGDAIVFLDSHCETNIGWLEPLLKRIQEKKSSIVCPSIDFISATNFSLSGSPIINSIGGFWWSLHFRWDPLPKRITSVKKMETEPIP